MSLSRAERETVINMDDAGTTAIITTHQQSVITKLNKNPSAEVIEELSEGGRMYRLPARLISFRTGTRKTSARVWTPEQRAAAADRMRNARAAKS